MPSSAPRIKLFENRWLEKLTVVSAKGFIALWSLGLPAIAWVAWGSAGVVAATTLVFAGVILWTLTEYVLHRFLFHWEPVSAALAQFVFVMHGNHHAVPNDPLRNLMPPIVSISVGGLVWALMVALLGPAGSWLFLGWMGGYVGYDLVHYACHQWPMKGRLARMLKAHHMQHHHLHEDGNYAITGMMWDRLFRTRVRTRSQRSAAG